MLPKFKVFVRALFADIVHFVPRLGSWKIECPEFVSRFHLCNKIAAIVF